MNVTVLAQALTYLLPVLGLFLPGFFKKDGLPARTNGMIAFSVLLIVSTTQAFCAGQIGFNPYLDWIAVTGAMSGMLAGPLKWLDDYLQENAGITSPKPLPVEPPVDPPHTLLFPSSHEEPHQ